MRKHIQDRIVSIGECFKLVKRTLQKDFHRHYLNFFFCVCVCERHTVVFFISIFYHVRLHVHAITQLVNHVAEAQCIKNQVDAGQELDLMFTLNIRMRKKTRSEWLWRWCKCCFSVQLQPACAQCGLAFALKPILLKVLQVEAPLHSSVPAKLAMLCCIGVISCTLPLSCDWQVRRLHDCTDAHVFLITWPLKLIQIAFPLTFPYLTFINALLTMNRPWNSELIDSN